MDARVWYVNVYVHDFDRAVGFYSDVLGLPLEFKDEQFGYASFHLEGAGLGLATVDAEADNAAELVGRHTGVGLGVEDLEGTHAALIKQGVEFTMPPTRQPWGGLMALFQDPEGNVFYLDQLRDE